MDAINDGAGADGCADGDPAATLGVDRMPAQRQRELLQFVAALSSASDSIEMQMITNRHVSICAWGKRGVLI